MRANRLQPTASGRYQKGTARKQTNFGTIEMYAIMSQLLQLVTQLVYLLKKL